MAFSRPLLLVAAAALVSSPLLTLPSVVATAAPAASGAATGAACATPLFDAPVRATTARSAAPARFEKAVARNGANAPEVREAAVADATMWLDTCGRALYRDQAVAASERGGASTQAENPRMPAGTDVFALSSRPGSSRTIALDFRGEAVSGTAWNEGAGPFTARPYSIDGDTSGFSEAERMQVYKAWLTVAEDFAPFDVNVTTAEVSDAAIARSSREDTVYGTRVVISDAPQVSQGCGCGGVAYMDVFDIAGPAHDYYQPAWVLTTGSGTDGWDVGEVASHEAGHTLSLAHDGHGNREYYSGSGDWAPIMGASFGSPLSQWSRGEYAGASNTEDDLALIAASGAPYVGDDHGDTTAAATTLSAARGERGLIGTSSDVDVFALTGSGRATVTVSPAAQSSNLDVQLTVLDASGATVAVVNPRSNGGAAHPSPDWLGASWTGTLPASGGWSVRVDGVGTGDPRAAGGYSGYGSLGRYAISLTTQSSTPPSPDPGNPGQPGQPDQPGTTDTTLEFLTGVQLPTAVMGRSYRRVIQLGGPADAVVRWTSGRLPGGLSMTQRGDQVVLAGKPRAVGRTRFTLEASSSDGQVVSRTFRIRVRS